MLRGANLVTEALSSARWEDYDRTEYLMGSNEAAW